jgi:hypothetical protein
VLRFYLMGPRIPSAVNFMLCSSKALLIASKLFAMGVRLALS